MKEIYWQLLKAVWASAILISMISTWLVCRHFAKKANRKLPLDAELPGVSIFKPLRGVEDGISENIESFFRLDYPKYEILLSVADADDATVPVVRALMSKYPKVDARLIIGAVEAGPNPKVNNMIRSYQQAKYGVILISDSNVRVQPIYLKHMVSRLDEGVGVVTSLVFGSDPRGSGGMLEATFLDTFYVKMMIFLANIGMPCVLGKSMLFRKETLDQVGGMAGLKDYIAEDYSCGRKMLAAGFKVATEYDPLPQHIGNYPFETFWNRHVRWGRIRKLQNPPAFVAEIFYGSIGSALVGAAMAKHFYHVPIALFLCCHFLIWLTCDMLAMRAVGRDLGWKLRPRQIAVWALREMSHIPLWFQIAASNTILWRGQKLRLNLGGTICTDTEITLEEAASLEPLPSVATRD